MRSVKQPCFWSWDILFRMVTNLRNVNRVICFNSRQVGRPAVWPIQHAIQWVISALTPQAKQPDREADSLSPPSVEVKNQCSYISTRLYALMLYKWATLPYVLTHSHSFAIMTHLDSVVNL